jgi:hypothetical protein
MTATLKRRVAEFTGTLFLLASVVGSGVTTNPNAPHFATPQATQISVPHPFRFSCEKGGKPRTQINPCDASIKEKHEPLRPGFRAAYFNTCPKTCRDRSSAVTSNAGSGRLK